MTRPGPCVCAGHTSGALGVAPSLKSRSEHDWHGPCYDDLVMKHAAVLALASTLPLTSLAQQGPPTSTADAVVQAVLTANPEIEALEAQVAAMDALVERAGVRPDPSAAVEYSNVPLTTPWPGEHPMSGVQLKVSQTLLAPGKIDARVAEARQRVRSTQARVATLQNQLAGEVATGWHRLSLVRQMRLITGEHVNLVQQLIDVVKVSYEVGRASQHELLQLQTLHDRLVDDLRDFDRRERALVARLNAALHRAPDTAVMTPATTWTAPPGPRAELVAAVETHPMLRQLAQSAEVEARAADRALREQDPDFTVSAGYRLRRATAMGDAGEDFLSLGLSMPLPWFWNDERWVSQATSHRARARSLRANATNRRDRLVGEVDAGLADLERALQKVKTYEGELVDLAHRALDSTFAAYRVARAGFSQLYQAELALLDLERAAVMARTDAALAAVRLKTLTGAWVPGGKESR